MKTLLKFTSIVSLILILTHCKKEKSSAIDVTDFSSITKAYFDDMNSLYPVTATFNSQHEYNNQFQIDCTEAFQDSLTNFYLKYLNLLNEVDVDALDKEEKLSYEIMNWEIDNGLNTLKYPLHYIPITQFNGMHLVMGQLGSGTSAQPFETYEDYTNWAERLEKYTVWVDSAQVAMKKGIKQGYTLPKILAERMVPQFQDFITQQAEENLFYSPIKNFPKSISDNQQKELTEQYTTIINAKLVPAYQSMVDFLTNEYLPACRDTDGISTLKDGDKIYQASIGYWTTTDMSADEIHQIGLSEVARLRSEMEKVMKEIGYTGDLNSFFNDVRDNPKLKPFTDPKQVIENFYAIQKKMEPKVQEYFSLTPKTPFEVRRVEAFREKTASASYQQGSPDGSRPGIFYVPIPDVKNYNFYADEDLFLHEAIPGHHFQISLQQENQNLPDFRKFAWIGAFGEGWALYCESLGEELGLYEDPYQYFGMLSNEMLRAVRLVVDTGIHTKGWTREQAIQYCLENMAEPESSIISEIERYMSWPGQALGYKIGQLKILEMRQKAMNELGDTFNMKDFHQITLESGVLPLSIYEDKVLAWIDSQK